MLYLFFIAIGEFACWWCFFVFVLLRKLFVYIYAFVLWNCWISFFAFYVWLFSGNPFVESFGAAGATFELGVFVCFDFTTPSCFDVWYVFCIRVVCFHCASTLCVWCLFFLCYCCGLCVVFFCELSFTLSRCGLQLLRNCAALL